VQVPAVTREGLAYVVDSNTVTNLQSKYVPATGLLDWNNQMPGLFMIYLSAKPVTVPTAASLTQPTITEQRRAGTKTLVIYKYTDENNSKKTSTCPTNPKTT
jgi:hypothetical protein